MFHGRNERIGVRNYAQLIGFFRAFHVRQARTYFEPTSNLLRT